MTIKKLLQQYNEIKIKLTDVLKIDNNSNIYDFTDKIWFNLDNEEVQFGWDNEADDFMYAEEIYGTPHYIDNYFVCMTFSSHGESVLVFDISNEEKE